MVKGGEEMSIVDEAIRDAALEMHLKHQKEKYKEANAKISQEYREGIEKAKIAITYKDEDEYIGVAWVKAEEALVNLDKAVASSSNMLEELKIYRKYVPELIKDYRRMIKINRNLLRMAKRLRTDSEAKKYKRWTNVEDNELIELVCNQDLTILDVSLTMGRTVPAIKTRVSKLVGLKRLSQEVAGKFIGNINGNHTECVLEGTLYKEEN